MAPLDRATLIHSVAKHSATLKVQTMDSVQREISSVRVELRQYRMWCVVVCDLETSRIGAPYIYIYIYNIICTRVNTSAHCSGRKQVKG